MVITKILLPQARPQLMRRERLIRFLHANMHRRLILISASAGYGKTSLLIDFAQDAAYPVSWYSLDPSDNDPIRFLQYLVASIRQQFPDFGGQTLAMLQEGVLDSLEPVINTFINEIQTMIDRDFVMVLDDYHEVAEDEQVNAIMGQILRYLPPHGHIIISSRALPTLLPLTMLTAKQQTAGLGGRDLRFTAEEIQYLAREKYGVDLSMEDAQRMTDACEGWITGILLTTPWVWGKQLGPLAETATSEELLFQYLAEEVYRLQPEPLQRFLLLTSIIPELNPSLCDALLETTGSAAMLQELAQRHLFVSRLEGAMPWFRYHPLFREFLIKKLQREEPEVYSSLQLRAGQLAEGDGRWDAAVEHYLQAECPDMAAQLIQSIAADMLRRGQWRTLSGWMEALPPDVLDRYPLLKLWRARIFIESRNLEIALRLLDELHEHPALHQEVEHLAHVLIERANVRRLLGDAQGAIADCQAAMELEGALSLETRASLHRVLGTSYIQCGQFGHAVDELNRSLELMEEAGDLHSAACVYQDLGTTYEALGQVDRSLQFFEMALRYWEHAEMSWGLVNALNSIGVTYYLRGEYDKAKKTLETAMERARASGATRIEAYILSSLGDLYRDQGHIGEAIEAFQRSLEIAQEVNEGFIRVYSLVGLGDTYRLAGQLERTFDLLRLAESTARDHQSSYELGLCHLALGIYHAERGELSRARERLMKAQRAFQGSQAQRELGRTELQLGYLALLEGDQREAITHLGRALRIADEINTAGFMMIDGPRLLPLYRLAQRARIGSRHLTAIREEIEAMRREWHRLRIEISEPNAPGMPYIRAFGLGPQRVFRDGDLLERRDWGSAITRELFFYLLEHRSPLRRDEIIQDLWPDLDDQRAGNNFHSTVYRLRRAIGEDVLLHEHGEYQLNPKLHIWYDVEEFESKIRQAQRSQLPLAEQERLMEEAVSLYRGDFLSESPLSWCVSRREALRELYVDTLVRLAGIRAHVGNLDGAIEAARQAVEVAPLREEAYVILMQTYALKADTEGIKRWYEHCREAFREELDAEPPPEVTELYDQLING
ncbi:MAG: hypothetical protein Kow0047_01300 [Anaerolineae bacterium]